MSLPLLHVLTIGLVIFAHLPVAQASDDGPYLSLLGGGNWVADQNLRQNSLDFVQMSYDNPLSSGYALELALGWRRPSGLRPELALSYRKNSLGRFEHRVYENGSSITGKGQEAASSLMANLWYDLPMPDALSRVKPYLGGGLGYTRLSIANLSANGVAFGATHRDDVQTWQLGAGIVVALSERWSTSLDYRDLRTRQARFGEVQGLPNGDVSTRYHARSVLLGIRYVP